MDNNVFDDIEIIDDFDEELPKEEPQILGTESWLSDFTQGVDNLEELNVDVEEQPEPQADLSTDVYKPLNMQEDLISVVETPINYEQEITEDLEKVVIAKDVTNINNDIVSNLVEPLEEKAEVLESEKKPEIEEVESKRSVIFIGFLFTILIIVIILLPYLSKIFGK